MKIIDIITENTVDNYMHGDCASFAAALFSIDSARFSIVAIIAYANPNDIIDGSDYPHEMSEDDMQALAEDDPRLYDLVIKDNEYWVLVHACVRDSRTGEYIDANGRYSSVNSVLSNFPAACELMIIIKTPVSVKFLKDISRKAKWAVSVNKNSIDRATQFIKQNLATYLD